MKSSRACLFHNFTELFASCRHASSLIVVVYIYISYFDNPSMLFTLVKGGAGATVKFGMISGDMSESECYNPILHTVT